jgi:hypothetical protein
LDPKQVMLAVPDARLITAARQIQAAEQDTSTAASHLPVGSHQLELIHAARLKRSLLDNSAAHAPTMRQLSALNSM